MELSLTNVLHVKTIIKYISIVVCLNAKKIVILASNHTGIVINALKAFIYIIFPVLPNVPLVLWQLTWFVNYVWIETVLSVRKIHKNVKFATLVFRLILSVKFAQKQKI